MHVPERWSLWLCPECRWLGWSEDGHCRQFDEHPDGERVALESVTVVLDQPRGAVSADPTGRSDYPGDLRGGYDFYRTRVKQLEADNARLTRDVDYWRDAAETLKEMVDNA